MFSLSLSRLGDGLSREILYYRALLSIARRPLSLSLFVLFLSSSVDDLLVCTACVRTPRIPLLPALDAAYTPLSTPVFLCACVFSLRSPPPPPLFVSISFRPPPPLSPRARLREAATTLSSGCRLAFARPSSERRSVRGRPGGRSGKGRRSGDGTPGVEYRGAGACI